MLQFKYSLSHLLGFVIIYLVGGDFWDVYRILPVLSGLAAILLGAKRRRNVRRAEPQRLASISVGRT